MLSKYLFTLIDYVTYNLFFQITKSKYRIISITYRRLQTVIPQSWRREMSSFQQILYVCFNYKKISNILTSHGWLHSYFYHVLPSFPLLGDSEKFCIIFIIFLRLTYYGNIQFIQIRFPRFYIRLNYAYSKCLPLK